MEAIKPPISETKLKIVVRNLADTLDGSEEIYSSICVNGVCPYAEECFRNYDDDCECSLDRDEIAELYIDHELRERGDK